MEWVAFPETPADRLFHFEKVGKRQHLDIAGVNSAACLRLRGGRIGEARLAAGGVAPVPLLLRRAVGGPGRPGAHGAGSARGAAAGPGGDRAHQRRARQRGLQAAPAASTCWSRIS